MLLIKTSAEFAAYIQRARSGGGSIGFIPTMGALHQGHISLVTAAARENRVTAASIFVNPAQFNDKKDFEKYPVTIEKDIEMLEAAGCHMVFLPSVQEIYPPGYQPRQYGLGYLETILEGAYRPGHFQGVCQVMDRLLHIVQPDNLYMGQKDYQQCMVVNRLLNILQLPVTLHTCPTLREPDGLAMSSRNTRLTAEERKKAPGIFQMLRFLREQVQPGDISDLLEACTHRLAELGFRVDYVAVADAHTLELLTQWNGSQKIVGLAAAFQNEVRLIDNMLLN